MVNRWFSLAAVAAMVAAGPAWAKEHQPRAAAFQHVVDCRAMTDNAQRLACFDREVAALDAAEKASDIVVVDRAQVQGGTPHLFGLPLPNFHLFGGNDDHDANDVSEIQGKIAVASPDTDGWRIRLEDGSVWVQTDGKPIFRTPKAGLDVVVKRGALGSYFLSVNGAPGVKVRRAL